MWNTTITHAPGFITDQRQEHSNRCGHFRFLQGFWHGATWPPVGEIGIPWHTWSFIGLDSRLLEDEGANSGGRRFQFPPHKGYLRCSPRYGFRSPTILMHINDLPSVVTSHVRSFADDCLMYRPIRSIADQIALQQDLAALERWGDTWGMRFNAGKCHSMHISRSRVPMSFMYELCGQVLFSAEEAQYLGVTLTSELSWSPHINSIANRANVSLGFLKRNLKHCPSQLKETAYIALVCSVLEYACAIWDPHLRKDVDLLERVQRRAHQKLLFHCLELYEGQDYFGLLTLESHMIIRKFSPDQEFHALNIVCMAMKMPLH